MNISHLYAFKPSETIITIDYSRSKRLSMEQKQIFKRFFRQQIKVQKLKLQLPDQHPLKLKDLKALFQMRNIKEFHLLIESATDDNFKLIHQLLLYIKKRKMWPLKICQTVTLKMTSRLERDPNGRINQLSEDLWKLRGLLKRTCTNVEILFESMFRFDLQFWKRFVEVLTYLTSLKRVELKGEVGCQEFEKIMESVKSLKMLEKISFCLKPWIEFYSSSDYFENIGKSLRSFSLQLDLFDVSSNSNLLNFVAKLRMLTKLQYFNFQCNKLLCTGNLFFELFSESLSKMTDLRGLNLWLGFERVTEKNILKDGIGSLFATIGGLAKLETIFLGFEIDEEHEIRLELLCESLNKLKKLKSLGLSLAMPKTVGQEIEPFLVELPKFKQLEELFFSFRRGKELENGTIELVFKSMAQLKWLKKISLNLKCGEINREFVTVFHQAMNQLRCLKEARIRIHRAVPNIDAENSVMNIVERLQEKMNIDMMFEHGN